MSRPARTYQPDQLVLWLDLPALLLTAIQHHDPAATPADATVWQRQHPAAAASFDLAMQHNGGQHPVRAIKQA